MVGRPESDAKRATAEAAARFAGRRDATRALQRRALSIGDELGWFPFLRKAPLFKGLTDEEIRLVAASCAEEERDSGDVIFVEGSTADRFYIVMEGRVEVWNYAKIYVMKSGKYNYLPRKGKGVQNFT
jgi:hypothetical protein